MALATGPVRFGPFELDCRSGELRKEGAKIPLQEQPLQLLALFLEHAGEVVTREEIQKRLWPADTFVDFEHSLNAAIKRLRDSLADSAAHPQFIETLPRHGYRFIAPVEIVAPGPSPIESAGAEPVSMERPGSTASVSSIGALDGGASRRTRSVLAIAFVAVAIAALLLVAGLRERASGAAGMVSEPRLQIRSIAILPLENLSGDPAQEYFAEGMTDALITELGQIHPLSVRSRTSIMLYKGRRESTPEIARDLKVDAIIEGAVLRSGDRVRITAQLIEGKTDRHLWARTYERDVHDVLALQSEVAHAIANEIKIKVTPQNQTPPAPARKVKPEAYEAYLKGRYYFTRYSPETSLKAVAALQLATEKDPGFAPAYAALSPAYGQRAYWGFTRPAESTPPAWAAARKAVELDDTLAEGHCWLGAAMAWGKWDWAGAERELQRAIELNPNLADAHQTYAMLLGSLRRQEEAMAEIDKALELDPFNLTNHGLRGFLLHAAHKDREAIEVLRNTLEMGPQYLPAHWELWKTFRDKGMYQQAIDECRQVFLLMGNGEVAAALNGGSTQAGYQAALLRAAERLAAQSALRYVAPIDIALLYAHAGRNEEALIWLERAYKEPDPRLHTIWMDPTWDNLRSDPRFQDLVRRMNFPE